tara:strand:- start:7164 stop:8450 length:1287 start_codon:yes stop_codon:yes gene_type:complete
MQFLWKYIDDLVGKGLELSQISELLFYASARFVPIAIPIAMLLSSLMVFGKLGEQYELVAIKSAGISFYRILLPLIFLVSLISYGSFLFSNYIMPIANLKNGSMIYDIQRKKPALNIKEGIFYKDIEGFSIKINKKDADGVTLKDIIIYDHTSGNGNEKVITAESGKMEITINEQFLELTLYNGHSYIEIADKKRKKENAFRTTHFKEDLIRFDLASFNTKNNSEKLYKGHYAMLNNKQLSNAIDSLQLKYTEKEAAFKENIFKKYKTDNISNSMIDTINSLTQKKQQYNLAIQKIKRLKSATKSNKEDLKYKKIIITKHKIEWHRKVSLAVACLLLFIIGASLGSIIRKGGFGMPVLVSIIFFIFFHVLNIIGEKSAKDLSIEAYQGMWLANLIFLPVAIFLVIKAKNDYKLVDFSKIRLFLNQIKK